MSRRLTAQQIMENYEPGDWNARTETKDEFWNQKLAESQEPREIYGGKSLYEHLQEHGQKSPVIIGSRGMGFPSIFEGHHRLAALHHINPHQFVKYRSAKY